MANYEYSRSIFICSTVNKLSTRALFFFFLGVEDSLYNKAIAKLCSFKKKVFSIFEVLCHYCQLSLWANISNRFQSILCCSVFLFIFVKMCPTYQTSSVLHTLFRVRNIWLHGLIWNKHPPVAAPHVISALFTCCSWWFSSGLPDVSVDTLRNFTWQGEESEFLTTRDWHVGHEHWGLAGTFYKQFFKENAQNKKTGS